MTQTLTGTLTAADHKGHIAIPFDVPAGTTRLVGQFSASPKRTPGSLFDNLISLSLFAPNGSRGSRHNNPVWDFSVTPTHASPGYLPGTIEPGQWSVVMDTFRLDGPVTWELTMTCETAPFAPHPAPAPGKTAPRGPGWYRGDLHAHTLHSDGSWDIPDLVGWARDCGLDFITLTDHNTPSGHAQVLSLATDDLLTLGGIELTTHYGHALTLGRRDWQEWRTGPATGLTMPGIATQVMAKGALFIIAHPMSEGDPACTGCRWEYDDMRPGPARIVEIWNGGPWSDYNEEGLALYLDWLTQGHRLVATAGSDVHGPYLRGQPVGFNHVHATALTEAAILEAVSAGRNYLSSGPKLILTAVWDGGQAMMGGDAPKEAEIRAEWSTRDVDLWLEFLGAEGPLARHGLGRNGAGQAVLRDGPVGFVLATLRDATGRLHAVTNPIFIGSA